MVIIKNIWGKGLGKPLRIIHDKIAPAILGFDVTEQVLIDQLMIDLDGTKNKVKLGANAILGVSLAVAKAAASDTEVAFVSVYWWNECKGIACSHDERSQWWGAC